MQQNDSLADGYPPGLITTLMLHSPGAGTDVAPPPLLLPAPRLHVGTLLAGTSHYRASGSSLELSANISPGGCVYKLSPSGEWLLVGGGRLPAVREAGYDSEKDNSYTHSLVGYSEDVIDTIQAMVGDRPMNHDAANQIWADKINPPKPVHVSLLHSCTQRRAFPRVPRQVVFDGKLYATALYHRGVFSYSGGSAAWECAGDRGAPQGCAARVALLVHLRPCNNPLAATRRGASARARERFFWRF